MKKQEHDELLDTSETAKLIHARPAGRVAAEPRLTTEDVPIVECLV